MTEVMLTTLDNEFNPFDNFDSWLIRDIELQHFTCERLARLVEPLISDDMTQSEIDLITEQVMDDIIKHDPLDLFQKVTRSTTEDA